jgi:O-antigen/teichoic acid export membrane protein
MSDTLHSKVRSGLIWSVAQSWGVKALNLLLYLILARLLTPVEFGIAAAVALVLLLQQLVAEFGFGEALIQRPNLLKHDVTLPFLAAVSASVLLSLIVAVFAKQIEQLLNVPDLAPYLVVASLFAPLATATAFQESMYKRDLDFKPLAIRQFVALIVSGVVGVSCALSGLGAWSLIAQSVTYSVVGMLWLWRKPRWVPTRRHDVASFRTLGKFGASVFSTRLIDFGATRSIDIVIVTLHGAAALGIYSIGAKLYQTAMELLSRAFMEVSLSALSKLAHDRVRLVQTYRHVVSTSSLLGTPVFFAMAALSPEITHLLFGDKWAGSAAIMAPLMLIGGMQCIQFANGSYLSAIGRPHLTLWLTLIKLSAVLPAIIFIPSGNVAQLVNVYALALLVVTPFSFGLIAKELGIRFRDILLWIAPGLFSAGVAYGSVWIARGMVVEYGMNGTVQLLVFGTLYSVVYLGLVMLMARASVHETVKLMRRPA